MRRVTSMRLPMLLFLISMIAFLDIPVARSQESVQIAGKMVLMRKEFKRFCVDKEAGHYLCLYRFDGNNKSTGQNSFMDNADSCNCIFADFIDRNGPVQGYGKLSNQGGSALLRWEGYMTTVKSPDGKPAHRLEGSFRLLKGTGKFANIEGLGTFQGKMSAWTVFIVEYEGEYSIRK